MHTQGQGQQTQQHSTTHSLIQQQNQQQSNNVVGKANEHQPLSSVGKRIDYKLIFFNIHTSVFVAVCLYENIHVHIYVLFFAHVKANTHVYSCKRKTCNGKFPLSCACVCVFVYMHTYVCVCVYSICIQFSDKVLLLFFLFN